jgi:sec-independent protein translocase protein TatA
VGARNTRALSRRATSIWIVEEIKMPQLGLPELIIVLVIVLIVFGASRLRGIGQGLGGAISAFRREVKQGREEGAEEASASAASETEAREAQAPPQVNQESDEGAEDA